MKAYSARIDEDKYVDVRGLRFHYRDWSGEGQPIVLLHGLASNCHIWDRVAPLLTERFSVAALDQRSHGESEGTDEGYDFPNMVADVRAFLGAAGIQRPIVAGHSWGGNVALHLAANHPDDVSGLVFVDGGFIRLRNGPARSWEEAERAMAPPDLTHFTIDQLVARSKEMRWGDMWHSAVEAVMRASFQEQPDGTIRPRLHRERHMKIVRALWEQDPTELYPKVKTPVLILPTRQNDQQPQSTSSRPPKEETVGFAETLLAKTRTVWLEDSIHDVPLQRPGLVAEAIIQAYDEGFFSPLRDGN